MITLTETEEESRKEPHVDKGKRRAFDSLKSEPVRPLKRKRSVEQDDTPGPSKKLFCLPEDEEVEGQTGEVEEEEEEEETEWEEEEDEDEEDGSYTDTSSSAPRYVKTKRAVKYKRKSLTCEECRRTFTTNNTLERHALTHVKDKVLFVCAGEQGM